jgi:Major Facilitator Superfamily
VRGIAVRFCAFSALADLVPLYPLYALLFADSGLGGGQIGSLFVLWSVASIVLEVPTGALADVVSRRALLFVGGLLNALGFGLWVLAPGYWAFAAGFLLRAAGGALASGTLEALVHDELAAVGAESAYQRLSSAAYTSSIAAMMAGTASAGPLFALGGYRAVGVASVLTAVAAALVALTFPAQPRSSAVDGLGLRSWFRMLRSGLAQAAGIRRLVLIAALLPGFGAMDEFFPLLAGHTGAATTAVPLLMGVIVVGQLAGGASARWVLRGRTVGLVTAAGGLAIVAGALSGSPWGLVLVALGYGAWQHAEVVVGARLQAAVSGPARATVTSVAGLGAELAAIQLYVLWGLAVGPLGDGAAVAVTAASLLPIGLMAAWFLGDPSPVRPKSPTS